MKKVLDFEGIPIQDKEISPKLLSFKSPMDFFILLRVSQSFY